MNNRKIIEILVIIISIFVILGPIIINLLFKWNSNIEYIESEWDASSALNYYGIIIGAIIGIMGVFITVLHSQKKYSEDIKIQSLPFFALNILEKKSKQFDLFENIEEVNLLLPEEIDDREYNEYKPRQVYFIIEGNKIIPKRSLSREQKLLLTNNGITLTKGDKGEYIYGKDMMLSFPLEFENVGRGAAINVRIGLNKKKLKKKTYLRPENIKVNESYYVNIFSNNIDDNMVGNYLLEIAYEDIYQTNYIQQYAILIEKENEGYTITIDFKSNQKEMNNSIIK